MCRRSVKKVVKQLFHTSDMWQVINQICKLDHQIFVQFYAQNNNWKIFTILHLTKFLQECLFSSVFNCQQHILITQLVSVCSNGFKIWTKKFQKKIRKNFFVLSKIYVHGNFLSFLSVCLLKFFSVKENFI